MTCEMSFAQKVREHRLIQMGMGKVQSLPYGHETVDKVRRNDHIARPHRRKKDLAESSDIDHTGISIETLQRSDGHAAVAVFAVVIILHYPRTRTLGPIQKLQTTRCAHCCSQRVLM